MIFRDGVVIDYAVADDVETFLSVQNIMFQSVPQNSVEVCRPSAVTEFGF